MATVGGGSIVLCKEHVYSLVLLLLYWIIGYSISEVGKVTWDNVSKVQRKQSMKKGFVNCQVLYAW